MSGILAALREDPDVLVVGGGPAGSTVANLLARRGRRVVVVDRAEFPRPKPCGECLNPGAVSELERLGLLDTVLALDPARLAGWHLRALGAHVRAAFPDRRHRGLAVARSRLDAALLDRCRSSGAEVVTGVHVLRADPGPRPAVSARLPNGSRHTLRPKLLIGADGLRSRIARSVGPGPGRGNPRKVSLTGHVTLKGRAASSLLEPRDDLPRGTLFLGRDGTVGLAPIDRHGNLWNATVVLDPSRHRDALRGDPARLFDERLRDVLPGASARRMSGLGITGPFHRPMAQAGAPGTLLVGDAAGYYDPLTGQGIYRALRSAWLAAGAAEAMLAQDGGAWRRYDRRVRAEFRGPRRIQRIIEGVVGGPMLGPVLRFLEKRSRLADRLIAVTGDHARATSLMMPELWVRHTHPTRADSWVRPPALPPSPGVLDANRG